MAIGSVTSTSPSPTAASEPKNPLAVLGKDDFLKLLVTQLKYQNPLSPTDNQQFMAQMAQFSMVEGINNLESTMTQLQGVGLIGKTVAYSAADGSVKSGVATSIAMDGTAMKVQVGTDSIDPSMILGVAEAPTGTTPTTTTTPDPTGTGTTGV